MKTFNFNKIIFALMSTTILISTVSHAKSNQRATDEMVRQVLSLENNEQFFQASVFAATSALKIADQLNFDEVALYADREFTEKRKEIITKTTTAKAKASFLGLISIDGHFTDHKTQIITVNAEKVSQLPRQVMSDLSGLERRIIDYADNNQHAILMAKVHAAKAFELAMKATVEEKKELYPLLMQAAQSVSRIQFIGSHELRYCVRTKHAGYEDKLEIKLGGLFFSGDASFVEQYHRYTTVDCSTTQQRVTIGQQDLLSPELIVADYVLANTKRSFELQWLRHDVSIYTPDWGLGAYLD